MAVGNENLSLGPPLLGLVVGLVLFGVTLLQAYQYFLNYTHDLKIRKLTIAVVCCLDSLHSVFAVAMVYSAVTSAPGFTDQNVIWSMKGSALTKVRSHILAPL
ncbi:hypothetical protein BDZ97DRAFT_1788948 [Flammula alnicola]|nr:hypothetical protein BDZ97DRAFT_1788948 [Flammula alnicola]